MHHTAHAARHKVFLTWHLPGRCCVERRQGREGWCGGRWRRVDRGWGRRRRGGDNVVKWLWWCTDRYLRQILSQWAPGVGKITIPTILRRVLVFDWYFAWGDWGFRYSFSTRCLANYPFYTLSQLLFFSSCLSKYLALLLTNTCVLMTMKGLDFAILFLFAYFSLVTF